MNSLTRVLIVVGIIGFLYFINTKLVNKKFDEWTAKSADVHMNAARKAADKNALDKCIAEIEIAIHDMEAIEEFSDDASKEMIEKAIRDLKDVEEDIKHDSVNVDVLNLVFAKGINTLAYTYLKISDEDLLHDHEVRAVNTLKIVIDHLYNSMGFLNKKNVEEERIIVKHIYNVIDSLKIVKTIDHRSIDVLFDEINGLIIEEEQKLYELHGAPEEID